MLFGNSHFQTSNQFKKTESTQSPLTPKEKSSPSTHKFIYSDRPHQKIDKINRLHQLQSQIAGRQKSQLQLQAKFNKCIAHMLTSIENTNKNNSHLADQLHRLRNEIAQNQHDIEIIDRIIISPCWQQAISKPQLPILHPPKLLSAKKQLRSCNRPGNQLRTRTPTKLFSRMSIRP